MSETPGSKGRRSVVGVGLRRQPLSSRAPPINVALPLVAGGRGEPTSAAQITVECQVFILELWDLLKRGVLPRLWPEESPAP